MIVRQADGGHGFAAAGLRQLAASQYDPHEYALKSVNLKGCLPMLRCLVALNAILIIGSAVSGCDNSLDQELARQQQSEKKLAALRQDLTQNKA